MKLLLRSYKAQVISLLIIWMAAMVFSAEFILSQVMILLVAMALLERRDVFPWLGFRKELPENTRQWYSYRANLFIAIPFLLVLVSAFWSSDMGYTLERLRIKLPFLILPWAFVAIPGLGRREFYLMLYFLLGLMTVACLYVGVNYLAHFAEINEMISRGKPIPTPSNHIRFSLVLSFAVLGGMVLIAERFFIRHSRERWLVGGMTVFLLLFVHILSVRSGLAALYLALFVLLVRYVLMTRRWGVALIFLAFLVVLPGTAYQLFPSFRTKVSYMYWDLAQFREGGGGEYSDSERLASMKVGWEIGRAHPWFGVGAGDLRREMAARYPEGGKIKMPHNQLLTVFAGTGAVGLAVFLIGFFFPLFYRRNYRDPLFLALHVILFFSFLMESTLENNFGVSFFLLFLLLGLNVLRR